MTLFIHFSPLTGLDALCADLASHQRLLCSINILKKNQFRKTVAQTHWLRLSPPPNQAHGSILGTFFFPAFVISPVATGLGCDNMGFVADPESWLILLFMTAIKVHGGQAQGIRLVSHPWICTMQVSRADTG